MSQIIDDILERALRSTPQQRNLEQARERLVPLLERYGYHLPPPSPWIFHTHTPGDWPYAREDPMPLCKNCDEEKPYRLYIEKGHLVIHHGCLCTISERAHEIDFLNAMILVLGRLDAQAHLDPGENGNGPWLRIYL